MKKKELTSVRFCTQGGIVAALYVVFTLISSSLGLASGPVQIRISESLCILPCFFPASIPGLFIGCFFANILTGSALPDVIAGSITTLIAAAGTHFLRFNRFLAALPPILLNTFVIPLLMIYVYHLEKGFLYFAVSIGIGEILSAGILGQLLYSFIKNRFISFTSK